MPYLLGGLEYCQTGDFLGDKHILYETLSLPCLFSAISPCDGLSVVAFLSFSFLFLCHCAVNPTLLTPHQVYPIQPVRQVQLCRYDKNLCLSLSFSLSHIGYWLKTELVCQTFWVEKWLNLHSCSQCVCSNEQKDRNLLWIQYIHSGIRLQVCTGRQQEEVQRWMTYYILIPIIYVGNIMNAEVFIQVHCITQ